MNGLTEIFNQLQDPDTASSVLPLLIVFTFIVLGSVFAIYKVVGMLRGPGSVAPKPKKEFHLPEFHWKWPKFDLSGLWAKAQRASSPKPRAIEKVVTRRYSTDTDDLDFLRELVRRLEQMNAAERELHGRALRKIEELQGEIKTLGELREQEKRVLDLERQARQRLESKCRELEDKLRDAIRETERIFSQSTALASSQTSGGLQKLLKDFPPSAESAAQSSEDEKELLKKVLDSSKRKLG